MGIPKTTQRGHCQVRLDIWRSYTTRGLRQKPQPEPPRNPNHSKSRPLEIQLPAMFERLSARAQISRALEPRLCDALADHDVGIVSFLHQILESFVRDLVELIAEG